MGNVSKELLREYIKDQHFTNANEVLAGLKEMFKDVLQEALEAEMDEALGYCKYEATSKNNDNSRNGYSKKRHRWCSRFWNWDIAHRGLSI